MRQDLGRGDPAGGEVARQQELPGCRVAGAVAQPRCRTHRPVADREGPPEVVRPEQRVRRPRGAEARIVAVAPGIHQVVVPRDEVDERVTGRVGGDFERGVGREQVTGREEDHH